LLPNRIPHGASKTGRCWLILARRSELVALATSDVEFRADGTLRVLVRRGKADPFGSGRLAFTSSATARLLRDWLNWRGDGQYLFCPIYKGKVIDRDLSTTTVKRLVKFAARSAGADPGEVSKFSGHSM
jgi:integrase